MTAFENPQTALLQSPVYGVITGQFVGLSRNRLPLVLFPGQSGSAAQEARSTVTLDKTPFGAEVVLQFDQGDVNRPIVLGVIQDPSADTTQLGDHPLEIEADGQHLHIQAKQQLILRCGDASITLTRAGKVLIKGNYVSTHATGTHRIKGGCVQIN